MHKYEIIVPVSGGKDSQAVLKLAVEEYGSDKVLGLFCDTQFEHPLTYQQIEYLKDLYKVKIETITAGSVPEKVEKHNRFPSGRARHCTEELKIRPAKLFYNELADKQGGFEVWYGVRRKEGPTRAKRYADHVADELYYPHEYMKGKFPKYLGKKGVMIRLPIIDWFIKDVYDFVGDNYLNPLYSHGFDRVGCFPCLAAGKEQQDMAYSFDETGRKHNEIVIQLEEQIGTYDRYGNKNDPGCSFCSE